MRMSSEICFSSFLVAQWWFQRWLSENCKSDGGSVGNADYDDDADGIGVGVLTVMLAVMLYGDVYYLSDRSVVIFPHLSARDF